MAHLVLTVSVLGIYGYMTIVGVENEVFKSLVILAFGYWFGARGQIKEAISKRSTDVKKDDTP